jgi:hypothetical protein
MGAESDQEAMAAVGPDAAMEALLLPTLQARRKPWLGP